MKIAVVSIFKNEIGYVLEWVAYYRKILGINDFIIADNVSDDGTSELLSALDDAKVIKRIYHPRIKLEEGVQKTAYARIIKEYSSDYDYFLIVDADEFLVNNTGVSIQDFIAQCEKNDDFSGLALNWKIFGSSGRKSVGEGLVIERFSRTASYDDNKNSHIKSLLKTDKIESMHIHHAKLQSGRYYDENVQPVVFSVKSVERDNSIVEVETPFTTNINNAKLYVAHFVIKSKTEHTEKKKNKGSSAGSSHRVKGDSYFTAHDRNDVKCFDLFDHSNEVRQEIAHIVSILHKNTHFFSCIEYVVDNSIGCLRGWVVSDNDAPITLRMIVDGEEREFITDVPRPDLLRKGISKKINSGFYINIDDCIGVSSMELWVKGNDARLYP
jgi:hypothetical protein